MEKIIECIPNFSEGKRPEVVEAIVNEIRIMEKIRLLDYLYDSDYNRLVVTFIGEPDTVKKAALNAASKAIELVDMKKHRGQHPRIGAVDVVPFVPIKNVTMEKCIQLSKEFGRELAERFEVPVYLYGEAATRYENRDLDYIRKGGYEGLKSEILKPERKPDFGPQKMHPTAGATVTGARKIMVGFNVNLGTSDIKIAKKIAKALHTHKGGLFGVKAMGASLKDRNLVQVGISIGDFERVPIYRVLELIKVEAQRYGVQVVGSEFCGMVPLDAIVEVANYYLQLENFNRDKIIEMHLKDCV